MACAALSGCLGWKKTPVDIKDQQWYGSLGSDGAAEFHTLSNESHQITEAEFIAMWENLDDPMVATNLSTFTEIKKEEEQLCTESKLCSPETIKMINKFYSRLIEFKKGK